MNNLCIIGGTSLQKSSLFKDYRQIAVKTDYGQITLFNKNNYYFIQRHLGDVPPHQINYRGYIQAATDLGVKNIIGVYSVGSLKKKIKPGKVLIPHDFISPFNISTFFDGKIIHIKPCFSKKLRNLINAVCKKTNTLFCGQGVYLQTFGPRLETPAEIKLFSKFADVVGMTLGNETTLICEKGMNFAAICGIDNYANGINGKLNIKKIEAGTEKNKEKIEKILKEILKDR